MVELTQYLMLLQPDLFIPLRSPFDSRLGDMESRSMVQQHHVEWRCRAVFFHVACSTDSV